METLPEEIKSKTAQAIQALNQRNHPGAETYFTQAVSYVEDIDDPAQRRKVATLLSVTLLRCGYQQLALQLTREAVRIDQQSNDYEALVVDLIRYGWALHQAHQEDKAAEAYQQAGALGEEHCFYANAASAATNLAVLRFTQKKYKEAESLLQQSLRCLKREGFPDTEIRTCVYLVMVWYQLGKPSDEVLGLAKETLERLGSHFGPDHRTMMFDALEAPLKKFFRENPTINSRQWVRANFPSLDPR